MLAVAIIWFWGVLQELGQELGRQVPKKHLPRGIILSLSIVGQVLTTLLPPLVLLSGMASIYIVQLEVLGALRHRGTKTENCPGQKQCLERILQNHIPIDYDDENDEYDNDIGDNFDAYDDDNDQKPDNYHDFVVKIYPL